MENDSRQRAFKFVVTACVISAMYYFVAENIRPAVEVEGGSGEVTGTDARIIAVAKSTRKANRSIKAGFDEFTRIDELLSEDINRVNQDASAGPVKVSAELFEFLQISIDYCKLTKGEFDITVCDSNGNGCYEKLVLDAENQTVRFAAEDMQLDLGGIGKGYAIDKAVEIMKRKGAIGGLVDAGGIIRCFGKPAREDNWLIENSTFSGQRIADSNEVGMVLKLRDMAAASNLGGVTIIAPRAAVAEVIASAVTVLGAQKGLDLVDSLLGVEAIIAAPGPEYRAIKSSGADKYIQ